MIFRQLFDRESFTYTYLIGDAETKQAVLIDPVLDKIDDYLQLLSELHLSLSIAMDTHTHADHISAIGALRDRTQCKSMLGAESQSECVSRTFRHGDAIPIGRIAIQVLHTPGHTDDSYSFLLENEGKHFLFSGDTLLIRGTGRTDFQQGNAHQQFHSLFDILLALPDDTRVFPGHDYRGWSVSTIGEEKAHNPRLQVADADAYADIMDNLNLPNPTLMDIAIPANQACGKI